MTAPPIAERTPPGAADPPGMCNTYSRLPEAYDEMWDEQGRVRRHWEPYIRAIEAMGCDELGRNHQEALRILRENGITYNIHGNPHGVHRKWTLDAIPLILGREDWAAVESGLNQRARLLDLILGDLYGDRTLIKESILPLDLIYRHDGFIRQCDGIRIEGPHQLLLYSADLARGPDQRLWVLADHAQNPTGIGYALENRTAMAHVFPGLFRECKVTRLSNFFRDLRSELAAVAPHRKENPRIVILSPGPGEDTYFEHAYLAAYLGYTLVQGEDLTVRDGFVWLKSLEGLQLVDVILRRVDDHLCDPLELRQNSRFGVAGLLEAVRRENVVLANPPGAGILENAGLSAFLPRIARHFLNQDLILSSPPTWWCGREPEMNYVLEHLNSLIIKTIHRDERPRTVFGPLLNNTERRTWRERIRFRPHRYVGQEMVDFSTAPILSGDRLTPRHAVLRTFLIAREEGYAIMPGGIARSASNKSNAAISGGAGGTLKDTWVIAAKPQPHVSLWLQTSRLDRTLKSSSILPSRAAENLFWVGRYAERSEAIARMLRTTLHHYSESDRFGDEADAACLNQLTRALSLIVFPHKPDRNPFGKPHSARPEADLAAVIQNAKHPGSLSSTLQSTLNAAYAVRDRWSTDTWRVVNDIEEHWTALQDLPGFNPRYIIHNLDRLITDLMALAGLSMESMSREPGWMLLDIGRRIERALMFIDFFRQTLVRRHDTPLAHMLLEAVLITTENIITYRRRYRSYLEPATVLDLVLMDENNPRALMYQLVRLQEHIQDLPRESVSHQLSEEQQLILKAYTRLRLSNTASLARVAEKTGMYHKLDGLLVSLRNLLIRISDALSKTYFSHTQESQHLVSKPAEPVE